MLYILSIIVISFISLIGLWLAIGLLKVLIFGSISISLFLYTLITDGYPIEMRGWDWEDTRTVIAMTIINILYGPIPVFGAIA